MTCFTTFQPDFYEKNSAGNAERPNFEGAAFLKTLYNKENCILKIVLLILTRMTQSFFTIYKLCSQCLILLTRQQFIRQQEHKKIQITF